MEVETAVGGHDVSSAADNETDAQLAQAAEPIGEIKEIAGNVGLFRADGEPVVAEVGTPIYLNDRVVTGSEGAVEFVFVDDTTFSVGANGEIAIDTLIYNPGGDGNALGVSVVKGAFVFLTGQIAPAAGEGMVIDTPAMNLGIRGTSGACQAGSSGVWTCAVLPDPGTNHVGRIVITNPFGTQVLDVAFEATQAGPNQPPSQTIVLTPEQVTALFADALQVLREQFPELAPNPEQRGDLDFNPEDINPAAGEDAGPDLAVDFGDIPATPEALAEIFGTQALAEVVAGLLADQFGGEFGAAGALTDGTGDTQGFAAAVGNSTIEAPQQTFTPTESSSPFALVPDANAITEDGAGGPAAGDVLANDAGPGTLQVTQVNGETANVGVPVEGAFGTLTLNADGTYDYVLNNDDPAVQALGEGETAVDSFSYRASDGSATSAPATLAITVVGSNDTPVAVGDDGFAVAQGQSLTIAPGALVDNDSDIDGDALTVTAVSAPENGEASLNADGSITYVPDSGFVGQDSFTYTVSDGHGGTATATVSLVVTNLPPTPPVDTDDAPDSVAEAPETGTLVGIDALSTDPDLGDVVTYSLSDDAGGRFQIDATTGVVTVKDGSLLDFEAADSHNITVAASDGTQTSTQSFTIGVTDIAENKAPVITSNGGEPAAAISVAENTTAVTTVIAIDPDGQTPAFSIVGGADAELFTIDEETGALSFAAAPDFEAPIDAGQNNVYDVIVQASDGTLTDTQAIAATVTNANETPSQPVDTDDNADSVAEGAAAGTLVGVDASSTDPDLGDVVTYSLTDDAGGRFQIDGTTGIVTVKDGSLLDFETAASHDITVAASDGKLTSTQTFTIGVADVVENNPPVITSNGGEPTAAVSVAENTKAVTTVTAFDSDAGQTPTFSIVGGADAEFFTIDKATGALSFAGFPNFETPFDAGKDNVYDVIVQASDGTLTDTQAIAVTVTDVNEAPSQPVDNDDASNSVAEGAATGTLVGITAHATDPDLGDTVTYSLADDAGGRFQIDGTTGIVTVKDGSLLDFETATSHNITVEASDGKLSSTQSFTIGVADVDEPGNQAPVAAGATASGNEDDTVIAVTLGGTDADGTVVSVTLTSLPPNGLLFTDDSLATLAETGVAYPGSSVTFYFAPAPDFSGSPSFQYTVIDNEGAADSTPATATIIVAPQPDPPTTPIDDDGAPDSVAEGAASGTPIGITALSTDPDLGDSVTYSLLDDAGGRFQIDADTGVVTVKDGSLLDFEAATKHDIVVQTSDGALTSSGTFTISVANANEAPTIDDAAFGLAENTANGTAVGTAAATDPDAGDVLNYAITAGNVGGAYAIDTETGVIKVANSAALDFETNPSFELTVEVTDALGAKDTATVTINLTDVNEAPFITSNGGGEAAAVTIAENTKAVTIVAADDVDAGQTVTFSIAGGADAALFAIDESTGALTFLSAPDFETLLDAGKDNIYDVVVEASDGTLIDTQSIAVTVSDVNEAPSQPVDSDDAPNTVAEASETGTSVGVDASSTDPDLGDVVTYSLSDDADGRFRIDATTGLVTVNDGSLIDFETATSHNIIVAASDGTLTSKQTFTIAVTDIAENEPPVITSDGGGASAVLTIDENTTTVTSVTATDPDGQTPTFSIVGGADAALFAIDKNTGALSFLAAPNFEVPADAGTNNVYDVVVQASDGVLTDQQAIAVTVADVNEAPDQPIDDNDAGNSVAEGAAAGTLVGITAQATDPDIDNKVTYSLTDDAGGRFQIDATTGVVTVKNGSLLDFETAVSHSITVAASDGKLTSTETFTIGVTDVDETQVAPTLDLDANDSSGVTGTGYQTSYNEGGPAVPIVDTDVSITDPDDTHMEQVTIQVSPNPDGAFEQLSLTSAGQTLVIEFGLSVSGNGTSSLTISGSGTEALYQAVLRAVVYQNLSDSPTPGEHQVLIQVSDGTSLSNVATAVIDVVATNAPPVITSNGGEAIGNATIAENSTAVTTVTATDADAGQTLSFSILGGADSALFAINSTSGELSFITAPDFEGPADSNGDNKYEVAVKVSDGAGGSDTQVLVVTVTDVAGPPVVTNNGLLVAQAGVNFLDVSELSADDDDTDPDQITYKLKTGPLHGAVMLDGVVLAAGIGLFTQQDLLDGSVTYVQDGTAASSDSFDVEISDGTTTTTETIDVDIFVSGVVADGDVVGVPNDGPIVVGNKTAGSLGLAGADGDVESSGAVIADQAGSRGIVTMFGAGATWSVGSDGLVVGSLGKGELVIENGAKLTITADGFNDLEIGRDGGIGMVTVTGAGSELRTVGTDNTILLGRTEESTGELIVKDGGSVSTLFLGIGVVGTGKVTVTGDGSVLTASNDDGRFPGEGDPFAGQVWVGWEGGGVGALDVLAGGLVEIRPGESGNTDTREPGLSIGRELGSQGAVVVDGPGSLIHIFGQTTPPDPDAEKWGPYAQVGRHGQGTMTVSNDGQVLLEGPSSGFTVGRGNADEVAGPPPVIPQSLLTIESGGDVIVDGKDGSADLTAGQQSNGDGRVVVTGEGSTLVVTGQQAYVGIGNHGAGILTVEDGADVTVASTALYSSLFIGDEADSIGVAYVRGAGTTVSVTGTDAVISVGDNGTGQLAIEDGALVNTFFMQVGRAGDGTVVVDGADTKLIVSNDSGNFSGSDRIYAGFVQVSRNEGSSGELDVTGGATVEIRNGTLNPGAVEPGLQIGRSGGSDGEVNVSGPGSQIVISQDAAADGMRNIFGAFIQVGREGSGRLSIDDGGQVLVNGDQAELRVGARDSGFGVLDIENGSRLTVNGGIGEASAAIGAQGFGQATVAGAGSVLEILGADTWLEIGQVSFGQLTIADGGTVTNVGTTLLGSNGGTGVVTINNPGSSVVSTFNAGQRLIIGAVEEWGTFGSGTVTVNSLGVLAAGAAFAGDADILVGQFSLLDIGDGATVNGDVALLGGTLSAGDFATGTADLQGDLDADSGMLRLDVAGNEAGSTYDLIDVAGNASLHDLTLDFTFSIAAVAGDSFEFLTAAFLDTAEADYAVAIHGLGKGLNFSVTSDVDGVSLNILSGAASGGSSEYFLGSFRDDTFFGSFSDDSLSGNDGNDSLYGSEGSDTIDGGADDDTLFGAGGGDSLLGGFGNDLLDGGDDNTILAFDIDDTISGGDGDDTVRGGTGYDSLDGGLGTDTVDYLTAIRGVIVNLAFTTFFEAESNRAIEFSDLPLQPYGVDTLSGFEDVIGSGFNDTLIGSVGANSLSGGGGTDLLLGLKGADTLEGGDGFDDVDYSQDGAVGGSAGVIVNLADGVATDGFGATDLLFGIEGVIGTMKADSITGSDFAEVEIFRGLKGNDTIDGGDGFDEVDYSLDILNGGFMGVLVDLGLGTGKDAWGETDKLSNIEAARGTSLADTLIGGTADERFRGLDGSDSINGGDGFDTVDYSRDSASGGGFGVVVNLSGSTQFGQAAGTAKDDFGNTDTLAGIENVFGTVAADTLIGGAGGSQLQGEQGADTLLGGNDGDTLFGGDDGDSLNGGGGGDTLVGGKGADTLVGGLGADVYQHSGILGDGNDIVQTGDNGVDVIVFTTADLYDLNYTREGNDLVIGAAINSDYNFGDTGSVTVKDHYLGASIAYVQIDTANYNLLYGTDKDIATFYFTTDLKNGIDNLDAAEFLQGTDGDDEINANGGVYDLVDGNEGNDTIHGGEGSDNLRGTGGDDQIFGDKGDDRLRGDAGDDTLDGGSGIDEVRYNLAAGGVIVNLASGIAQDIDVTGDSGTDQIANVENVQGSELADSLTGNDEANRLRGLDGDDTLAGGAGSDTLFGSAGNDRLDGGGDADQYRHGVSEGFDTVVGADGLDIVVITGANLYDLNYTREGNDLVIGAAINSDYNFDDTGSVTIKDHYLGAAIAYAQIDTENYNLLYGTDEEVATFYFTTDIKNGIDNADAAEVLQGTDGDDEINGNGGFYDALYGGRGQDTIDGGAGFDNIRGGRGNDSLLGGLGDDMLRGDEGNDTLDGGDGSDAVRYNNADGGVFVDLTISGPQLVSSEQGFDTLINIENLEGSQFQDMLIGNNEANHLRGRGDSDTLVGGGGFDRLDGEGGNDILAIINTSIDRIDGGDGDDTLRIDGSGVAVDMTSFVGGNHIVSIERIDLGEGGANSLSLTAEDVLDIADNGELIVLGGLGDSVTATGGWTPDGSTSFGDHDFNVYVEEVSGARLLVDADISVVSAA